MVDDKELTKRFTYHPVRPGQAERYTLIRSTGRELADMITTMTPTSREQALALTKLEETVMWANAAIARNETGEEDASG